MAIPVISDVMNLIFGETDYEDTSYEKAKADEAKRQAKVDAGLANIEDVFSQYDQDFYDRTSDAYMDYAQPQLEDQYAEGLKQLQYALARGGRFNSSTEVNRKSKAAEDLAFQQQELASNALEAAAGTEQDVADAKERMIKLNEVNANPDLAASLSNSQAGILNQPPKFDPLVDVFGKITAGLAQRDEIENRRKTRESIQNFEKRNSSRSVR